MAQDAQLISQASKVESLASDGLVSVSTGAGQPQKNMELAKFADSLGSSVPLQQTSEQVIITGLYARTSDGKMVELTKESVAKVIEQYITTFINTQQVSNSEKSIYKIQRSDGTHYLEALWNGYFLNFKSSVGKISINDKDILTDVFGYNTLAELSSGVAELLGLKNIRVIKISKSSYGAAVYAGNSLKSFFTYVVDANNKSDFIFSHTYFDEYKSNPVQTLIASKTLSFGASNNQGSQEIGNSSGQVIFYLISFD